MTDLQQILSAQGWTVCHPSNADESIAKEAFQKALTSNSDAIQDEMLAKWQQSSTIEDVVSSLKDSERKYRETGKGKAWKWATRLSSKITFYSNILDVVAQHHPEYVALAWGTIKFLLVVCPSLTIVYPNYWDLENLAGVQVILNHETMVKELCKALCRIGDALHHVRLNLLLYPTKAMQGHAEKLYAHIIEFVSRAIIWYNKSPARQCLAVICNPFQLKFRDIVDDIQETSRSICELAVSMSQVEIRQMRLEVAETRIEISATRKAAEEVRMALERYSQLHYSGIVDTNQRISQVQLSQLLTFVSDSPLADPEAMRQRYASRRNLRCRTVRVPLDPTPFQEWGANKVSRQILIQGSFKKRHLARDLAIDLIDVISEASIPVVWALEPDHGLSTGFTSVSVLKYMVSQILKLSQLMLNERSATLSAVRFQTTTTEEEWFALLGAAIEGLEQLYIIIDVELLQKCTIPPTYWLTRFSRLFESLQTRGLQTLLKIAFVNPLGMREGWPTQLSDHITLNLGSVTSNGVRKGTSRGSRCRQRTRRRRQRKLLSEFSCKSCD